MLNDNTVLQFYEGSVLSTCFIQTKATPPASIESQKLDPEIEILLASGKSEKKLNLYLFNAFIAE
jgi:hypothetical protein